MIRNYFVFFLFVAFIVNAQNSDPLASIDSLNQKKWVDSLYQTMSLEQKVGQLFMISVFSREKDFSQVEQKIKKLNIGGIIFSKGTATAQLEITRKFQKISKIPLLISMDAEWGLAMRLDSTFAYPWNMTLGAVKDNRIVGQVATQIAKHCKALGVHINFAPDVDINTNYKNPIIGNRSFGEDVENVTQKAISFIKAMQLEGVLCSVKHFPGHGDTSQDSHKTLPTILHSKQRLFNVEMQPFIKSISQGVGSVMIGHLNVPALQQGNIPSSLSYTIVTDILQKKWGYKGLIFTDALQMKGVSVKSEDKDVAVEAFKAGNDLLLMPKNVEASVKAMIKACEEGEISDHRLEYSVKKILKAKYFLGLNKAVHLMDANSLKDSIHTFQDDVLFEKVAENAITLIKNKDSVLPVKQIKSNDLAYLSLGDNHSESFYNTMRLYANIPRIQASNVNDVLQKASSYQTIIIGVHKSDKTPWDSYDITPNEREMIESLSERNKVILVLFASPYALKDVDLSNIFSVVVAYQNHKVFQQKAAQLLFGSISAKGVLPVSISEQYPVGTSISTSTIGRLSFGLPNSYAQMKGLERIDSIVNKAIDNKVAPGVQVVVAKKGKVIYRKSFGTFDYDSRHRVTDTTLYDLASLTKILALLPEMMYLYDNKEYTLEDSLERILPELKNTNKSSLKIKNVLSHYAGFTPWIPFYKNTLDERGYPLNEFYSSIKTDDYPHQVAKGMYLKKDYPQTMMLQIQESPLLKRRQYLYSDLPFYLFQRYIEEKTDKSLMEEVENRFYKPMGLYRMCFLPLRFFSEEEIAPSEQDNYFRHQKIQGYVHDMGAAMLGGVAGHAGVFSDATSVAAMMQMYLQKGYYAGKQYITSGTINTFNTCNFCGENVRRGLGFDKPQLEDEGPTCGCVPMSSFGHTGFTGTYAWADPENEIVYVFLSNRTYPSSDNKKLIQQNIRTKIQQVIYEALLQ